MDVEWWAWVAFCAVVVAMLAVDLLLFGRGGGAIGFGTAAVWSVIWTVIGVGFYAVLIVWEGTGPANEYLAGFLIEKSLSMDNLFVFALLFSYFAIPLALQRRVLFWGITGAIVLRAAFILAGAALLDAFHWALYLFGAFLVLTGIRMARHSGEEIHPERNPALKLLNRVVPVSTEFDGQKLFVVRSGKRLATPLFAALVLVAVFDVVFAIDSIPAIFAITRETFIVFAANAFSLLGLSALYFLLAGMMKRFEYLSLGLAGILVFIGVKMLISDAWKMPIWLSLVVIVAALAGSVGYSLWKTRGQPDDPADGGGAAPGPCEHAAAV
ncbi:MAG: TerC family protein [Thermoleophilia bacterium]